MSTFDPTKFIDREFEQELYENLLGFEDDARILAIHDSGGMGKSHLLQLFQYRCRTVRPRKPVSLIPINQLPDQTPLALIRKIVEDLSSFSVPFPNFKRHESAYLSGDFTALRTSIYLEGSNFQHSSDVRIAGSMANIRQVETVNVHTYITQLSPDQDRTGQEVCVNAFFDDLLSYCKSSPIVLMFDAYEHGGVELKKWIENRLLDQFFFEEESNLTKLLLVIAGRSMPQFDLLWSIEDCTRVLRSIKELGKWRREHVAECLQMHGFKYEDKDLDAFYRLIEMGIPPSQVVQAIQTLVATR